MKLLKKIDLLEEELFHQPPKVIVNGLQYVHAFRAFGEVVQACFGVSLDGDFKSCIARFKDIYLSLDISVTPKVCFGKSMKLL